MKKTLVGIALLFAATAAAHDHQKPDLDAWYQSLDRPDLAGRGGYAGGGGASCCNKTDCHETEAEIRGPDWWARVVIVRGEGTEEMGEWIKIPPEKVLKDIKAGGPGRAVLCHTQAWQGTVPYIPGIVIYCFVPPTLT